MPSSSAPSRFRSRHPALIRGGLLAFVFFFSFGTGLAYASWATICRGGRCPSPKVLDGYQPRQTSKLFAADGRFIAELGLERRTVMKLADIPKPVQNAFVITEDKRFYDHAGVDWHRVPGAVIANVRSRDWSEGFSTLSMQLARNIFPERLSREKSPIRKLKEIKVARDIERIYSKERILELYLNQIYFGNGAYGVESAAQRYFGKSIHDLNLAEAATLAAIPKSPSRYNPRRAPDLAVQRRNTVLELMRQAGAISDQDASLARSYPLKLATKTETGEVAPYFVEHIRQLLDEKFGSQLYEQGLKVYTTLDVDMQTAAERNLERQLRRIESGGYGPYRWTSYERYLARAASTDDQVSPNSPYLQGAFIAIDPRNGAIRALVGGRDFDDNKFNRATQALRQPGSTFKPIVYASAVQNGRPVSYLLDDAALEVPMGDGSTWKPQNYDGRYEGRIPVRRALAQSRNVATIRLGMELGEQSVIDMARKFGLSSEIPPYPSIHIGAAEVYPLELVAAYSAFASLGNRVVPQAIVRVEDANGEVLWAPEPSRLPVMSQEEAWLMVSLMKDVVQRGTAAGSVGGQIRFPAGGKTGTTNDGTDVWFIGYTSDLVAGVWMGFDKPKKIKPNAQGGALAAPAWTGFVNEVYRRRRAPLDWPMPLNIVSREIDATTNLLAGVYCPVTYVKNEFFIPGTDPMYQCDVHTGYLGTDTLGVGGYPPGTYPPGTYPPGTYPPGTYPPGTAYPPGASPPTYPPGTTPPTSTIPVDSNIRIGAPPRALQTLPRDSTRRDSIVVIPPRRDTILRPTTIFPRRDSLGRIIPDTGNRPRPDTTLPRPDTTRPRPDTTRPRPDTTRPRPDTTVRPRPDTTRPSPDTTVAGFIALANR